MNASKYTPFIRLTLPLAIASLSYNAYAETVATADSELFAQCASLQDNAARLVCYDELASGQTPSTLTQKRSLVLSDTIKSTVTGNPQVVLTEPEQTPPTAQIIGDSTTVAQPVAPKSEFVKQEFNKKPITNQPLNTNAEWVDANAVANLNAVTLNEPPKDEKKGFKERLTHLFKKENTYTDNVVQSTQGDVLTEIGVSKEALEQYTPLSLAYDLDKNSERGLWSARPHNANYILPIYYNSKPNYDPTTPSLGTQHYTDNEIRNTELKFQLSLKTKAAQNLFGTDADLWVGYTQLSHWQVYNEDNSRPFRAHDYEPEVFLTQPVVADLPFNGKLRMLGAGFVHHSNGESDPVSRSWNRVYAMGGAEWGKLTVMPRVWATLAKKEGSKESDNPDISDYYGYGDVKFLYQMSAGKSASGTVRFNPKTGKGGVQLDYVHPISRGVSGYVQLFQGYGQSIIDYNHEATSIGVGIMLNDWLGL